MPFLEWAAVDANARAAITWALPRAFFLWAAALTAAQAPVWAQRAFGTEALGIVAAVVLIASLPWSRWVSALKNWRRASPPEYSEIERADEKV